MAQFMLECHFWNIGQAFFKFYIEVVLGIKQILKFNNPD